MTSKEVKKILELIKQECWDIVCIENQKICEACDFAIKVVEKQEQDNNKSCDTCKYKNLPVSELPCDECYFASDFEDYYEPYTEGEL